MRVLSLFDGISCARVALERAGIDVDIYFASEIDKYAKQVSSNNRPDTKHLGDVRIVGLSSLLCDIDLLIGGSPCQDLSIAKNNRKGLDGDRSGLFREYIRILRVLEPKRFILENVASMPKEARDTITKELGVEPIMINAALVSAQNRKRLFWTNIPGIIQPEDRNIYLNDILENAEADRLKSYCIDANYAKGASRTQYKKKGVRQLVKVGHFNKGGQADRIYSSEGKSVALSALGGGGGAKTGLYIIQKGRGFNKGGEFHDKSPTLSSSSREQNNKLIDGDVIRKLTPIECERLQGLPDDYTEGISNTQRYKCLGNAFNVDVVAHILSFIPK